MSLFLTHLHSIVGYKYIGTPIHGTYIVMNEENAFAKVLIYRMKE